MIGELEATNAALALMPAGITSAADVESDTPNIETSAYQRSKPRWRLCRDLMIGTEAIRAGGVIYLPQHPNEGTARYNTRRVIAGLFNGFKRTVLASVGLLVQEEPTLGEDMPNELVELAENIDGSGTHLAVFTKHLATAGMVDGFAGIVTEYPRKGDPRINLSKASLAGQEAFRNGDDLDAADEKAIGLRPYFILVKADAVVLPLYETVNGKKTLVQLILREAVTERKGRFGLVNVIRYRVYELTPAGVFYERWTERDGKLARDEGPNAMRNITGIPWSPMVAGTEVAPNEYMPPLMDLANLNIEHHNIKTGILSLESLACVPTPVRIGATPDSDGNYPDLVLGPGNTIEAPATEGVTTPVYWLSPPVDVLASSMQSLENTKTEMGAMGAAFLAPQIVQETAAAKRMDASADAATISSVSRALKDCLESAFGFAGQYIKQPAGSVTLNAEFTGEGIDPEYLKVIVAAYQEGALSLEELRFVLQTGQLPEDFDAAKELDLVAKQAADREAEEQERVAREKAGKE